MARIINVIKDPHFCSWQEDNGASPHLECSIFEFRAFVEDDDGDVCMCHVMSDIDFTDGMKAEELLKQEKEVITTEEQAWSLRKERLCELVRGRQLSCSAAISLDENISELINDMESGGIDLKRLLCNVIEELYRQNSHN